MGAPPTPAAVFLSYSSGDFAAAQELDAALRVAGISTWFAPRDVVGGASFAADIVAAIRAATVVIVVFTANANASPHVRRELAIAADLDRKILPIRVDRIQPNDTIAYFLKLVQWMDASLPLTDALEGIVGQVRGLLRNDQPNRGRVGGPRLTPQDLLVRRDAVQLAHVHADRNILQFHARAEPEALDRLHRRAHVVANRLGIDADLTMFAADEPSRVQSTADLARRIGRSCARIATQLGATYGHPFAATFQLNFRIAGSVLWIDAIGPDTRAAEIQLWRELASQGVDLPTQAFEELLAQVEPHGERTAAVAGFRQRVVDHFEDQMIFEVGFARQRTNVWQMGCALAMAVHLRDEAASSDMVDDQMDLATIYARALGTMIPPLPDRAGTTADDSAAALHYLLQVLPRHYGDELADLFGQRCSGVLDAALRSQILIFIYHPEVDDLALAAINAMERALERAAVPPSLWRSPGDAVRAHAPFTAVRDAVFAMRSNVTDYLASLQIGARL